MADTDRIAKLEGRIRALEAVILGLPAVTEKLIKSAKDHVRENVRHRDPQMADAMLSLSGHLDEHAEEALDDLAHRLKSRRS